MANFSSVLHLPGILLTSHINSSIFSLCRNLKKGARSCADTASEPERQGKDCLILKGKTDRDLKRSHSRFFTHNVRRLCCPVLLNSLSFLDYCRKKGKTKASNYFQGYFSLCEPACMVNSFLLTSHDELSAGRQDWTLLVVAPMSLKALPWVT